MRAERRLTRTARDGDRLETLRALRDRLAIEIDWCESKRDFASLTARMVEVLSQIDSIEKAQPEEKGTVRDEVARKRAQRRAASKAPRRSTGRR